jgi:hypothetical protein
MVDSKFISIPQAQNYVVWYEEAQNRAMVILSRLFENPYYIWQEELDKYHDWQEFRSSEYNRNDTFNISVAAQYVEQKIRRLAQYKRQMLGL